MLESLPIEIFDKIAVNMPVADILRLGATSKTMRCYANSDILWVQLISRDLGDYELKAYHKQRFLCSGQESPKDYYLELFQTFDEKVDNFIAFSASFIDSRSIYSGQISSIFDVCVYLNKEIVSYEAWTKMDSSNKLSKFSKQYKRYICNIEFISSKNRQDGILSDYLKFMMYEGFKITALSLVKSRSIKLHSYDDDLFAFSPIALAVAHGLSEILDTILGIENTGSFFNERVLCYLFLMKEKIGEKKSILVHLLNRCPPSSAKVLFALIYYTKLTKQDLFDELTTMVYKTTSLQDKLNILENSIAIVDGKYNNALSFYFHIVDSQFDAVGLIKSFIRNINSQSLEPLKVTINPPIITVLDETTFPFSKFDESYVDKSLESFIEEIEENDSKFVNIRDDLNVINTEQLNLHKYENSLPISKSMQHVVMDDIRQEGLVKVKLQTLGLAILSIGVGLAFGLGLGLGAHVHIAASVLSSIISTVLIFTISARYNYYRFMGLDFDLEPVSQHVEQPTVSSNATSNNNHLSNATTNTFLPSISTSSSAETITSHVSTSSNNRSPKPNIQ